MMDALLGDREAVENARRLRPDRDVGEVLARAAWSVIAEPGDQVAGALIAQLGAEEALRYALERHSGTGDRGDRAHRAVREARARWMPRAEGRAVREAIGGALDVDARLLLPDDADWSLRFDDLGDHAPNLLWVRGDTALLAAAQHVSLVGARASTAYGEAVAAEFSGDLAAAGSVIVSGGAYGIDGAAHRAALGVEGGTIAFLAGGVDRAYPAGHQQLFQRIRASGAVVSELPCGAAPTKWRFLARNRGIAALGAATVVVEAGWRSGSLNTAGHAAALGRPLGAVPGPISSAASAGCHRLLREYDARCVTSAAEVRELAGFATDAVPAPSPKSDPDVTRLLDALSVRTARGSLELARSSGLAENRVRALLGTLQLEGRVSRAGDGWRAAPRGR